MDRVRAVLALGACDGLALCGHEGHGFRAGGTHTQDGGIRDVGGGKEAYDLRRSGARMAWGGRGGEGGVWKSWGGRGSGLTR